MLIDSEGQTVFFGETGGGEFLSAQLDRLGCRRILCVTGRDSYSRSGAEEFVRNTMGRRKSCRFAEFSPNPLMHELEAGLECFRCFKPDCIMGIGGGSAIDMAKLINFFGSVGLEPSGYLSNPSTDLEVQSLPLVAVPTTAGAGSEATRFAVLYENKVKHSVEHSSMLPNLVVLNPSLSESQTPYQVACCGFDAFSQAIESFWAVGSSEHSRDLSIRAIALCMNHLKEAVRAPTAEHRSGMVEAAFFSGQAINIAKTTAAHALSYTLTSFYGLPHGHAVAMMLPSVFACNAAVSESTADRSLGLEIAQGRMTELCSVLGYDSASGAVAMIKELCRCIDLDSRWIGAGGFDIFGIRSNLVDNANMNRLKNNPRRLCSSDLQQIVDASIYK